jgi:methylaspartate mutase epsilon subunit
MTPFLIRSLDVARALAKPSVADLLQCAAASGLTLAQPRCGVGGHAEMRRLLTGLQHRAAPDILTITIDSHTRLLRLYNAEHALRTDPSQLNGYPLVTHGAERGRELNLSVRAPLQVRHGSPIPGQLFGTSIAAGITSFEGGGISYNVPYAKDVPLADSLAAWQDVDRMAGELTAAGATVDREFFGSLTGVIVPPAIALAITILESVLSAAEGVRCLSIAYPQGGHPWQDLAALRTIRRLAARYLGSVPAYPVLHEFMGAFPTDRARALCLIRYGGLIAAAGKATKVITKSPAEARGIPDLEANVAGIVAAREGMRLAQSWNAIDEAAVAEEAEAIEEQVIELVDPLLAEPRPASSISRAFAEGRLDVPFAASRFARSAMVPCRDAQGAIRFADYGGLPFSAKVRLRNDAKLRGKTTGLSLVEQLTKDIFYFAGEACPLHRFTWWPRCCPD